jgi:glucokinase
MQVSASFSDSNLMLSQTILAADIGGTNTRLDLIAIDPNDRKELHCGQMYDFRPSDALLTLYFDHIGLLVVLSSDKLI